MKLLNTNKNTNNVILTGIVKEEGTYSYEIYGEKFYLLKLRVFRLKGNEDVIPITFSERLIQKDNLQVGKEIFVKGEVRTFNKYEDEKNKLVITIFAREILELEGNRSENTVNEVILEGYICKNPIYRKTPLGREITDLLVAVNRNYNKSDYIPAIVWGKNARYCKNLEIGSKISIIGRIQSRIYEKQETNGNIERRVAYELSINSLKLADKEENIKRAI